MKTIDINCDLGEGGKRDGELMQLVSSCNIACGGHYGNVETVRETIRLALKNKVKIGAHPSYLDPLNFGRKPMETPLSELGKTIFEQINIVYKQAKDLGGSLHHIKAHGALYNDLQTSEEKSKVFLEQILKLDDRLIVFAPPNSVLDKMAKGKIKVWKEGFADRKYGRNFGLLKRQNPGAVLLKKKQVLNQVLSMVNEEKIHLQNTVFLTAKFDTICIHGDTPNAVEILRYLHQKLPENNIQISGK